MNPFINGYLVEINQYPRFGPEHDLYTVKDCFHYNSSTKEYGHRDTVIPVECILNKNDIPTEEIMKRIINNKEPVMKRLIDLNNRIEQWVFVPKEETKNDN